jgi:hypothetical protein
VMVRHSSPRRTIEQERQRDQRRRTRHSASLPQSSLRYSSTGSFFRWAEGYKPTVVCPTLGLSGSDRRSAASVPWYPSLMPNILNRRTSLRVKEAVLGEQLRSQTVYIAPPTTTCWSTQTLPSHSPSRNG